MTYTFCRRIIENGTYGDAEAFQVKLDVFYMGGRLTQEQYDELTMLLASKVA